MRGRKVAKILSLIFCFTVAEGALLTAEPTKDGVPSWLSDADIVLIAETINAKGGDCMFSVTEIWKASKPIQLCKLGLTVHRRGRALFLIKFPPPAADEAARRELLKRDQVIMRFIELPISDDCVVVDSSGGQRRYHLTDLRIALGFEESKK
jgi:hypothetical protein